MNDHSHSADLSSSQMTYEFAKFKANLANCKFIKMKKLLHLMALAAFGVIFAFTWHKLEDGYCLSVGRTLTNSELINPAFLNIVFDNENNPVSLKDYLTTHPNCCAVNRHPATRSILDIATGFNVVEVEINYRKTYHAADPNKHHKFYKSYSSVSACGEFIKEEYGTSTSELENAFKVN